MEYVLSEEECMNELLSCVLKFDKEIVVVVIFRGVSSGVLYVDDEKKWVRYIVFFEY